MTFVPNVVAVTHTETGSACRCHELHPGEGNRHSVESFMQGLLTHRLVPALAMAAVVVALPVFFPSAYYYRVAALVFVFALAAIGLNLLMGFAGQLSLGHAGFMGIGAYAVAIGPTHLGLPSSGAIVLGCRLLAFVAFLVGRPILRLK